MGSKIDQPQEEEPRNCWEGGGQVRGDRETIGVRGRDQDCARMRVRNRCEKAASHVPAGRGWSLLSAWRCRSRGPTHRKGALQVNQAGFTDPFGAGVPSPGPAIPTGVCAELTHRGRSA